MANLKDLNIQDTGYLKVPSGTIAQRPSSPVDGMIRYNTDFDLIEYYSGSKWYSYESGIELFYEDFSGSSLNTSVWTILNPSNGTISIANGECTLTNTASTNNMYGIYSNIIVPVGATLEVRSKNTQARHAAVIGIGEGAWSVFPHSSNYASRGVTWYSRADNVSSTLSVRDDYNNPFSYSDIDQDLRSYNIFKMKRSSATKIEIFKNEVFQKAITAASFEEDYYIYFASDGWGNDNSEGNTITVIDYVKVY